MRKTIALLLGGLATTVVHFLFEALTALFIGPFSEIYPLLKDLTAESTGSYLGVFFVQGILFGLAYQIISPAFSTSGWFRKGYLFGLVLWILSAVVPVLPLYALYRIGFQASDLMTAIAGGLLLSEIMGISFVAVYTFISREDRTRREE